LTIISIKAAFATFFLIPAYPAGFLGFSGAFAAKSQLFSLDLPIAVVRLL
jgi:hypothetical protein